MRAQRTHPGIRTRHRQTCPTTTQGKPCRCAPTYEAWVFDPRVNKKTRKSFPTLAAARTWRTDTHHTLNNNSAPPADATTLREAAEAWLTGAQAGVIRTRSGDPYKPSALRGYKAALEKRILPELGSHKLTHIQRHDLQDLADRLLAKGLDPSTVRNTLMPLRAIYRRALNRGHVASNPTAGLELPAIRGRRDTVVSPQQASKLLAALPDTERALWATALYAGLRRGELMALQWQHIDLTNNLIHINHSWDIQAGQIEPKSHAGKRTIPLPTILRDHLIHHQLRTGRRTGLALGRTPTTPFEPVTIGARARKAWEAAQLQPITLHQARHTYASLMIAAGINPKALSTYMGHTSITITLDRYGHLMPGNQDEAATLLDAYLAHAKPG